jgi:trigger factor
MQVKRTHPTDTEAVLNIIATPQELDGIKQHTLGHFRNRVKIAGFREGKAPLELIEKNVDEATLQSEFLEEAINQLYVQAVQSEKIRPVTNPEVKITKFVPYTTLEFEVKVAVIGEIKIPDYKKVKKAKPEVKVAADEVKDVIKNLQTRAAEKKDVDRAAKLGDQVYIDFKGTDAKGEPVPGADGNDYPLVLGSNSFIPGFEENIVGMKAGEEKSFELTFPKDYHAKELAGAKVTFVVTATKVQEVVEPKLDDAFAASIGPFKTVEELKKDIKKQLEVERETEVNRLFENELIGELADKTQVSIPKAIVDEQIDRIEDQERQNLVYRGQTWEEHLAEEGITAEEHHEQKRPEAERGIRASLMLAEIAEAEGLDVTPEELEIRMQLLKGQYPDQGMQAELDKPENRRDIASRMLTEKTVAKLIDYATKK